MAIARHTSEYTKGLYCDGRECFEVLVSRRNNRVETKFYCTEKRGYFFPHLTHCQKGKQ